jgi:D-3-phosphoglycerate dehydrogenase
MNNRLRVLMAIPFNHDRAPEALDKLERAGFEVAFNQTGRTLGEADLQEELPRTFATIAGSEPYNERTLAAGDGAFRVIARMGVGYDQVDVDAASRHDVAVAMAFGTNHEAVADHAFSLIAALGSRILPYHRKVMDGRWGGDVHLSLWQATVGIIGLGRIGKALARRCAGFEMRILAHDTVRDDAFAHRYGIEYVDLERLFRESDFVSVHSPHDPGTNRIVNRERLALMKPEAFIVNTSRGGTVDEAALIEALKAKRIAGAGLDVFEIEPLPAGSPLRELDNVILTPHCAGGNTRSVRDMLVRCVDSIIAIRDGERPDEGLVLNPEVLR